MPAFFVMILLIFLYAGLYSQANQRERICSQSAWVQKAVEENVQEKEKIQGKKQIAITFDDGPHPVYTPQLLDGLKERGIQASFFLMGKNAESYPEIVKRMADEGHLIGNHTYSHVQLTRLSSENACEEIQKTSRIIQNITGQEVDYIRPPFGSWSDNLECGVEMFPVMWTIDPLDWATDNTDKVVQRVLSNAKENGIILLHDSYDSSVQAAFRIIDTLTKEGYEFVTVDELIAN